MPSSSKAQHNFMAAVAHSPAFAKKVGVPMSVGKDFTAADKGHKFGGGGLMAPKKVDPSATTAIIAPPLKVPKVVRNRADLQTINKPKTNQGQNELFKKGGSTMATKASNLFKGKESMKEELAEAKAIKSGKITPMQYAKGEKSEGVHKMAKGGFARVAGGKLPSGSKGFRGAKGSSVLSGLDAGNKSADGIARRGKTRGDNIVMKSRGGKC